MGKWYDQGYKVVLDGLPSDPPYLPGNKHYDAYRDGHADGLSELSLHLCDRYEEPEELSDFNSTMSRHHY